MTGRSAQRDDSPCGGTVGDTAALIDEAGGTGVAVVLDHGDDIAVAALFEQVAREHGRLDILVNNAAKFAGPVRPGGFWDNPLEMADLITVGLRCTSSPPTMRRPHHVAAVSIWTPELS